MNYFSIDTFRSYLRGTNDPIQVSIGKVLDAYEPSECITTENMDSVLLDLAMACEESSGEWVPSLYFGSSEVKRYYLVLILQIAWRGRSKLSPGESSIAEHVRNLLLTLESRIDWMNGSLQNAELRDFFSSFSRSSTDSMETSGAVPEKTPGGYGATESGVQQVTETLVRHLRLGIEYEQSERDSFKRKGQASDFLPDGLRLFEQLLERILFSSGSVEELEQVWALTNDTLLKGRYYGGIGLAVVVKMIDSWLVSYDGSYETRGLWAQYRDRF